MKQLLVRNLPDALVSKLKRRAARHGVSVEEEHRRILKQALARGADERPSLVGFLCDPENAVAPEVELDLSRSRDTGQRDTGF